MPKKMPKKEKSSGNKIKKLVLVMTIIILLLGLYVIFTIKTHTPDTLFNYVHRRVCPAPITIQRIQGGTTTLADNSRAIQKLMITVSLSKDAKPVKLTDVTIDIAAKEFVIKNMATSLNKNNEQSADHNRLADFSYTTVIGNNNAVLEENEIYVLWVFIEDVETSYTISENSLFGILLRPEDKGCETIMELDISKKLDGLIAELYQRP